MEVKIGIADSPRELIVNSAQSSDEVEKTVTSAIGNTDGVLSLVDEKGRKFLIQAAKISYVEIGPESGGRVGFAKS